MKKIKAFLSGLFRFFSTSRVADPQTSVRVVAESVSQAPQGPGPDDRPTTDGLPQVTQNLELPGEQPESSEELELVHLFHFECGKDHHLSKERADQISRALARL